jgi:hypothetical protein
LACIRRPPHARSVAPLPCLHARNSPERELLSQAFVEFSLESKFTQFNSSVAINDGNNLFGKAGSPVIFTVLGDSVPLWSSKPIQVTGHVDVANVDVTGIRALRLVVKATGSNACSHAVWVDPTVT